MKLCFSTVGCPSWSWSEILSVAKDLSLDGVELRGIGKNLYLPQNDLFSPENIDKVRADLTKSGLEVSCLTTEVLLHSRDLNYLASARMYIALAANLDVPYIRLLADTSPAPVGDIDEELVLSRLKTLAPIAQASGVTLLVETNGVYADTAKLARLIEAVDSPAVGVLWDIHHPYRYFGESPTVSYENIGKYTHHVHVKDSILDNGTLRYKMLGYGDLPIAECLSILKANNYDGYISLEWTKRWNQELEDAGIVFSHFAYAIKSMWNKA